MARLLLTFDQQTMEHKYVVKLLLNIKNLCNTKSTRKLRSQDKRTKNQYY